MKLIIRNKGGSGSGHYGHAGRPGEQGGSLPGEGGGTISMTPQEALRRIVSDPQMKRLAAALSADGSVDDVQNVSLTIEDLTGVEYPADGAYDEKLEDKIYTAYEKATLEEGYYQETDKDGKPIMTAEREAWEEYYYGRKVGGFSEGESFATDAIMEFLRTGNKPAILAKNAKRPGTADRSAEILTRVESILQDLTSESGKAWFMRGFVASVTPETKLERYNSSVLDLEQQIAKLKAPKK